MAICVNKRNFPLQLVIALLIYLLRRYSLFSCQKRVTINELSLTRGQIREIKQWDHEKRGEVTTPCWKHCSPEIIVPASPEATQKPVISIAWREEVFEGSNLWKSLRVGKGEKKKLSKSEPRKKTKGKRKNRGEEREDKSLGLI